MFTSLAISRRTNVRYQELLCQHCKRLYLHRESLTDIFKRHSQKIISTPYNNPSDFATTRFDKKCRLCRVFQQVYPTCLPPDLTGYDVKLGVLDIAKIYGDDRAMIRELKNIATGIFFCVEYRPKYTRKAFVRDPFTEAGCILEVNELPYLQLQKLRKPEIDFTQLKAWLAECCESHTSSCAKPTEPEQIAGMQVINVHSRDVVPATLDFDYAALSYVWGPEDRGTAQLGLPYPAPRTIENALEVTRRLGIRYLWVDRYCIRQDRKDEKHDQISKMHLIYHNARVTIIAAAGNGSEYGIPGIRGTPRTPQPFTYSGKDIVVTAFPHPTSVIKGSKWASRGWTYQEAALSRRRLAFTAYGAYFECNGPTISEGIDEPIRQITSKSPRKLQSRLCGGISAWPSHNIWQHISEFSKRDFSFQEDRFNALLGIFGSLEKSGELKGHLWGIPIDDFSTPAFLQNLMWDTKEASSRNVGLPSWSWTGWRGEICSRQDSHSEWAVAQQDHLRAGECIWVELLSGTLIPIEGYGLSDSTIKSHSLSQYIHIKARAFSCKFKLQRWESYQGVQNHWSPVILLGEQEFESPSVYLRTQRTIKGTDFEQRLASETWDVIFWRISEDKTYFLVLCPYNGHSERFGNFWGGRYLNQIVNLISRDRIFRLG